MFRSVGSRISPRRKMGDSGWRQIKRCFGSTACASRDWKRCRRQDQGTCVPHATAASGWSSGSGRVSRLSGGNITTFRSKLPQANALAEDRDGSIVAATIYGGLPDFETDTGGRPQEPCTIPPSFPTMFGLTGKARCGWQPKMASETAPARTTSPIRVTCAADWQGWSFAESERNRLVRRQRFCTRDNPSRSKDGGAAYRDSSLRWTGRDLSGSEARIRA